VNPRPPSPDPRDPKPLGPNIRGLGCGCALGGPGYILLGLIIFLIITLASTPSLHRSPLWFALIPLVLGLLLLYARVRRVGPPKP